MEQATLVLLEVVKGSEILSWLPLGYVVKGGSKFSCQPLEYVLEGRSWCSCQLLQVVVESWRKLSQNISEWVVRIEEALIGSIDHFTVVCSVIWPLGGHET